MRRCCYLGRLTLSQQWFVPNSNEGYSIQLTRTSLAKRTQLVVRKCRIGVISRHCEERLPATAIAERTAATYAQSTRCQQRQRLLSLAACPESGVAANGVSRGSTASRLSVQGVGTGVHLLSDGEWWSGLQYALAGG